MNQKNQYLKINTAGVIPEHINELYPELEKEFIQTTAYITVLKERRLLELFPKDLEGRVMERIVFRFHIYIQVSLHRLVDLAEGLLRELEEKRIVSAFILLRAIYENSAIVFDANEKLNLLMEKKDFNEIYKLIFNLQYGTRLEESIKSFVEYEKEKENEEKELVKIITAQQILNVIDKLSEEDRNIYNHLCEYAHPNYDGMMGSYVIVKDKFVNQISTQNAINRRNIGNLFKALTRALKLFVEGHDGIIKKLPIISEISIEYKNKNNSQFQNHNS